MSRFCNHTFYIFYYIFLSCSYPWRDVTSITDVAHGSSQKPWGRSLHQYVSQESRPTSKLETQSENVCESQDRDYVLFDNWDDISSPVFAATGLAISVKSSHAMKVNNAGFILSQKKSSSLFSPFDYSSFKGRTLLHALKMFYVSLADRTHKTFE